MNRRRPERLTDFRAGVLALAVLVLAVYFAWTRFGGFDQPYHLKAVFSGAPEVHSRTPVRIAGVDVGKVTSAIWSPRLERNIGYCWVPAALAGPGTKLDVETEWGRRGATVVQMPFVDPEKRIPVS